MDKVARRKPFHPIIPPEQSDETAGAASPGSAGKSAIEYPFVTTS